MYTKNILAIIKNQFNDFKAKGSLGVKCLKKNLDSCLDSFKSTVDSRAQKSSSDGMVKTYRGFEVVKTKCIECFNSLAAKCSKGFIIVVEAIESKVGKIHFDFGHLVLTSGVAVLVFAVTFVATGFNRSEIQASSLEVPKVETYNEVAIDVNFGDTDAIAKVAKEILKDEISTVQEPVATTLSDGKPGYVLGDYVVLVDVDYTTNNLTPKATLSIETKDTYSKKSEEKIVVKDDNTNSEINSGTVHQYDIKVNVIDNEAPVVNLTTNAVEIQETDSFDASSYMAAIVDNYDGVISDYTVEGEIPRDEEANEYYQGNYDLIFKATDTHGNVGLAKLNVNVVEDKIKTAQEEEDKRAEEVANRSTLTNSTTGTVSNSTVTTAPSHSGSAIAAAALAQLGVGQDCTMLVTNSIYAATGIYFHGWPTEYYALGSVVSNPQPGDICVYPTHVAIYIGNGMAVHGGWNGGTTAIASVYCSAGAPTYVRVGA